MCCHTNGGHSKQHTSGPTTCRRQSSTGWRTQQRLGHKNNNNMMAKGDAWSKFTSNTMEMKGHVFQLRNVIKNANQYHNTMEVLRQYVAKEYKTGRELMALSYQHPHSRPSLSHPMTPHRQDKPPMVPLS